MPAGNPAGFAMTPTLALKATDADPLAGATASQELAELTAAVQFSAPPPPLLIVTVCVCVAPPCWIWKLNADGATARLAVAAVTVRLTLTVSCDGVASGFEIVIVAV